MLISDKQMQCLDVRYSPWLCMSPSDCGTAHPLFHIPIYFLKCPPWSLQISCIPPGCKIKIRLMLILRSVSCPWAYSPTGNETGPKIPTVGRYKFRTGSRGPFFFSLNGHGHRDSVVHHDESYVSWSRGYKHFNRFYPMALIATYLPGENRCRGREADPRNRQ
ncbi:hypothetical protein BDM02DRAFT_391716 [Thelephora ganbajun]|uniref:Uncharacterized protein n=1 Tax=Thelephora ganbajun TaxID=370292 RepID=A0ACB6Z8S3_THEGA|nr:hypothetical protein BDM02DRAFT_391716 [Thelephora ganbajun]